MLESAARLQSQIMTGVIAGLAGGVLIDAYAFAAIYVMTGTLDVAREYQITASGLLGPSALASLGAVWIGVAVHFGLSIVWGLGYVYVAAQRPQLVERPVISGLVYGVVVYLLVLVFNLAANVTNSPEMSTLGNALVAHTLFFGIPIALIARAQRPA